MKSQLAWLLIPCLWAGLFPSDGWARPHRQGQAETAPPLAWDGRLPQQAEGADSGEPFRVALLRRQTEAETLAFQLNRYEEALAKARETWLMASRKEAFAGQKNLLLSSVVLRTRILGQLHRWPAMEQACSWVLPRRENFDFKPWKLVAAPDRLVQLEKELLQSSELQQLRQQARKAQQEDEGIPYFDGKRRPISAKVRAYVSEHFGWPSGKMLDEVFSRLNNNQIGELRSLGSSVAPALAVYSLVELDLDLFSDVLSNINDDPLMLLAAMDPDRARRLIVTFLEDGGQHWKNRVALVFQRQHSLGKSSSWQWRSYQEPPRCTKPEWLTMMNWLAQDKVQFPTTLSILPHLLERDALPEDYQREISKRILAESSSAAIDLLHKLTPDQGLNSVIPILHQALNHRDAEVRTLALESLLKCGDPKPFEYHDSSDWRERVMALQALEKRHVPTVGFPEDSKGKAWFTQVSFRARSELKDPAVFTKALQDPKMEVRRQAVQTVLSWTDPAVLSWLQPALEDSAVEVRKALAEVANWTGSEHHPVMEALARDPDEAVRKQLVRTLAYAKLDWTNSATAEAMTRIALQALPNVTSILKAGFKYDRTFKQSQIGKTLFLERCAAEMEVAQFVRNYEDSLRYANQPLIADFSSTAFANALVMLKEESAGFEEFLDKAGGKAGIHHKALRDLLPRQDIPRIKQVRMAAKLATYARKVDFQAIQEFLRRPDWLQSQPTSKERWMLQSIHFRSRPSDSLLKLAIVQDESIPAFLRQDLAASFENSEEGSEELARWVLDHWLQIANCQAVISALACVKKSPKPFIEAEALVKLAHDPYYLEAALQAMENLEDPAFHPFLKAVVLGEIQISDDKLRIRAAQDAVGILARLATPEAMQILLACLGKAESSRIDSTIENALNRHQEHEALRRKFQAQQAGLPPQDEAIAKTLAFLKDQDPEIRSAAALGLAAFGAKEAIPSLIPLLKDPSPKVQQAARQALAMLQGTQPN